VDIMRDGIGSSKTRTSGFKRYLDTESVQAAEPVSEFDLARLGAALDVSISSSFSRIQTLYDRYLSSIKTKKRRANRDATVFWMESRWGVFEERATASPGHGAYEL